MNFSIFREYDIRGIVGKEFSLEEVQQLTHAIITYFLKQNPETKQIVIGRDGRTHSPDIQKIVVKTITDLGLDVIDIGVCPTPTFYFSLFRGPAQTGFIITASHNPKEYNGFKICQNQKSVWGKQIQEIKEIYKSETFYQNKTGARGNVIPKGNIVPYDANNAYISWLVDHFDHLKNKNINTVIDCANGTAGTILPELVTRMGWKNVSLLYEAVDGTFPNHEADPTKKKNMHDVHCCLQENKSLAVGLGFDGDCDRMNPMTQSGYLVPGDQLLALFTKKIITDYPNARIVFDIKSSSGLIQALEQMGAIPCIAPSGHSIIKEHLREQNALLAGELSCHFFFNDRYFGYDDGIYAALRLFELLDQTELSFDELIETLPKKVSSPELRIPCEQATQKNLINDIKAFFTQRTDTQVMTIDGIRAQTPYGWGLIRASNTQPVVCLRFESDTQDGLQKIENDFKTILTKHLPEHELEEHFGY